MNGLALRRVTRRTVLKTGAAGLIGVAVLPEAMGATLSSADVADDFVNPPDSARPWVYWYFMDGHLSADGMAADLDAMKRAGIGGAIYLEVGLGLERGPVEFMSPQWQRLIGRAFSHADDLGLEIALAAGPGWCGTGGPWVEPEESMQILVSSESRVRGPLKFDGKLPRPQPRQPFFGVETLTPALHKTWREFYIDAGVLAFPSPSGQARITDVDEKALYTRGAYSSQILGPFTQRPWVRPFLPSLADYPTLPSGQAIARDYVVDLTSRLTADGRLQWDVPPGDWTIMRFGRVITGHTTRPAPTPGLGLETDKFSREAIDHHVQKYVAALLNAIGPRKHARSGLTTLHFDSWEMGSQNWNAQFQGEFAKRRGYDSTRFLPTFSGYVVGDNETSERFLWDVRQTAQELVYVNHMLRLREHAHRSGLQLSMQHYDLNPTSDLHLGAAADIPMGEFWSAGMGYPTEFSLAEATSVGHTNGRNLIGAEAFTADVGELWRQHPASMKDQGDWALCAGINRFVFHRFQAQPAAAGRSPGMTMGPRGGYGVHWDRTQSWWDLVPAYHLYLTRCQSMLRLGTFVADVLYLIPEGAPHVFVPPDSAFLAGRMRDRRGYNFDGCSPETLISRASVKDGRIVFPDGIGYQLLVLPRVETMTPRLLQKIEQLVEEGAAIVGLPPRKSPSLSNYPRCDQQVRALAEKLWGHGTSPSPRRVGKGWVWRDPGSPSMQQGNPVADATWIWSESWGGNNSEPETLIFSRELVIADAADIQMAEIALTACASFEVSVNGHWIGAGRNHHTVERFDLTSLLETGANEIVISASWSNRPAPYTPDLASNTIDRKPELLAPGVLGAVTLTFNDQTRRVINTDRHWMTSRAAEGHRSRARELGNFASAPWNLLATALKEASQYPCYRIAAKILETLGVQPDFDGGEDIRYIHRRAGQQEYYFVGNRRGTPLATHCTFRVRGLQPEWWNAVTGERRDLLEFSEKNGLTTIPIRLEPFESGFVVFRSPRVGGRSNGSNFPGTTPLVDVRGPWEVSFDTRWGGPPSITFQTLQDWSESSEAGIRFYSGKASYRAHFQLADHTASGHYRLSLGKVRNIARVLVNGNDLGTLWCEPWEIAVPAAVLKRGLNTLEVVVANLWINRLIGDSSLPVEKRFTWAPAPDTLPFRPDSPLQSSGLLGPVSLKAVAQGD